MNNPGLTIARFLPIFLLIILFSSAVYPYSCLYTENDSAEYPLASPQNIICFADYLYCQKDYLRAIGEYERIAPALLNDTIKFKIALGNKYIGKISQSESLLFLLGSSSIFSNEATLELFKGRFLRNDFTGLRNLYDKREITSAKYNEKIKQMYYLSFLFDEVPLPGHESFTNLFPATERKSILEFINRKENPEYKSLWKAVMLSALLPGAGKFYTEEYGDAITIAIVTGLSGYLACDNFASGHNFRAIAFTGLGALFYAGNIYGSAASAQIYNARVKFNLTSDLKLYLNKNNYFLPEYENFCK
ncbi:MAG: hypothetical protein WCJ01_08315 [Ignavibacteria bacterium]